MTAAFSSLVPVKEPTRYLPKQIDGLPLLKKKSRADGANWYEACKNEQLPNAAILKGVAYRSSKSLDATMGTGEFLPFSQQKIGYDEGDFIRILPETVYLPLKSSTDQLVVENLGGGKWQARKPDKIGDNAKGVAYRLSKIHADRAGEGMLLEWGKQIEGKQDGDWVVVSIAKAATIGVADSNEDAPETKQ